MRVFLTGGTGFLGNELARELSARGHEITALVRSPERATSLPPSARRVQGRVEDPASYRAELAGHDALVHAAAVVKMWTRDRSEFDRVNVEGTETMLRAAADASIPKLVYASSFMALGPSGDRPLAEDDPRRTPSFHNDYERTKHLADVRARALQAEGLPLWVLYPGVIYGPGLMTEGNIVARNVARLLNGMPFGVSIRSWSYAWVSDVVGGFVRVIEQDAPSRRYVLGGDNRTGEEFYRTLAEVSGTKPPIANIPSALASLTGWGEWMLAEAFGREPRLLTHEVARVYRSDWAYDSTRAGSELGYAITPLSEGLARLAAWLRAEGHVR